LLRFVLGAAITTLMLAGATGLGVQQGWWPLPTYGTEILLFLLGITTVVYYKLYKRQPGEGFVRAYLLSIVLKMVCGLALILFIVLTEPAAAVENAALFILAYLLLTFLEVSFLFKKFK
jgi:hypothetical protein